VGPGVGERNFHIFYQLTKGTKGNLRDQLGMADPSYFNYLSCSKEYNADGVNDVEEFEEMSRAMDICQIKPAEKKAIFDIIAGILHMGNIFFAEGDDATQAVLRDANSLAYPAFLFVFEVDVRVSAKNCCVKSC
jgi:myosin I